MRAKKQISLFLSLVMAVTMVFQVNPFISTSASASAEETTDAAQATVSTTETTTAGSTTTGAATEADMRLIFTTDIHGQVTDYNYQTSQSLSRGLNKAYTLIKEAREEAGTGNYLTFDVGDSIMDFNTDYIYSQNSDALQPVFNAMTKIGYDAITLGNHDFDYGYDYIVNQMETSGLMSKIVLSNVYSAINGSSVFGSENKIIEKTVSDDEGNTMQVKVGIIGETVPSLSSRTEGYKSKLTTEDIVENATKQATALKAQGADIIVALAHSGFGVENPTSKAADEAYALTKVDGVDVVLAGHEHTDFPTASADDAHYSLSGVDKTTGLVNGKRLVMIKDSCRGIGIVDLHLKLDENKNVVLDSSDYEIRKTTSETATDDTITATMSSWDSVLREYCSTKIGTLDDDTSWNNYSALLENNEVMQVVQNAQLEYASNYINNSATQYKDYPIVSLARYTKYGSESGSDYADLSGDILEGNADSLANYHRYVYIYTITGKQLKEWLEWSASIYQTTNTSTSTNWNNLILSDYINSTGGNSLVQEDFLSDWSRFYQCAGVEYTIDPSVAARYDYEGNKINDTNRITSLTRDGVAVTDTQKFVLVTDKVTNLLQTQANEGVASQVVSSSHVILQEIVEQYLSEKALLGNLEVTVDQNWNLKLPENYNFMLVSGKAGADTLLSKSWCNSVYDSLAEFNYYSCKNTTTDYTTDTDSPGVVLSPVTTAETNGKVSISVITSDRSGIAAKKYAYGVYDKDNEIWQAASGGAVSFTSNSFSATKNGVYSVYVEDGAGNVTVEKIAITNIYPEKLIKPTVDRVDNNDVKVTGTADPNLTVYVKSGSTTYKGTVGVSGSFSVSISPQKAKKKLYIYVKDSKGRTSAKTSVVVKRVGPNCPKINTVKNNGTTITGNTNDGKTKVYAMIDNDIYVSKSAGSFYYTSSTKYDKSYNIDKVSITVKSNGNYTIHIPNQLSGTKVKVFSVDSLGRVSYGRKATVKKTAPNRATIYSICSAEKYVFGHIPDSGKCTAVVTINGRKYSARTDKNGYFAVPVCRMRAGTKVTVYGKNGSNKGYAKSKVVGTASDAYKKYREVKLHLDNVTDKSSRITGRWANGRARIYLFVDGHVYTTRSNAKGQFSVKLRHHVAVGVGVYAIIRTSNGKSIKAMRKRAVVLGRPRAPQMYGKITVRTRIIRVSTKEKCTVTIKVGNRRYVKKTPYYSKTRKAYVYTFKIRRARLGTRLRAYARNSAGTTAGNIRMVRRR